MNNEFQLNGRFHVDPSTHEVRDLETNVLVHLEPRLIALLCALIEKKGAVVTREELTRTIWNDHGGADDALNQAISHLRKILHDEEKQMIRTIPKKGYQFQGGIERIIVPREGTPRARRTAISGRMVLPLIVLVIMVLMVWYLTPTEGAAPRMEGGSAPAASEAPLAP